MNTNTEIDEKERPNGRYPMVNDDFNFNKLRCKFYKICNGFDKTECLYQNKCHREINGISFRQSLTLTVRRYYMPLLIDIRDQVKDIYHK